MKIKLIVLGLVAIILGGLGFWKNGLTDNLQTYKNTEYGFSLTYPEGWKEESLRFSSQYDQQANALYEEECKNGCEGAYFTRGIYFRTQPHDSWLPVIKEKGTQKIGPLEWKVRIYEGSGLGIMAYESHFKSRNYVFWGMFSHNDEAKFEQLLTNFKPL